MNIQRRLAITAAVASLGAAGALEAQATTAAPPPPLALKIGKWNGTIRSTLMTASNSAPGAQMRYGGRIYIVPSESGREGVFKVEVELSSNRGTESLEWAMSSGRCGSPLTPIISISELPTLDVRPGGDASVKFEGAFNLTAQGTYHIDIMRGGHAQNNIVACADARYQKPDK